MPAAMAMTFFERAADLAAHDVVVAVDPEQLVAQHGLQGGGHAHVVGGDHAGRGLAGHDLPGQVGPGQSGGRVAGQQLLEDLRSCAGGVPGSMPLVRLTTGIHGRIHLRASSMVPRKPSEGTPTISTSASRTASSRSAVARSRRGRVTEGR